MLRSRAFIANLLHARHAHAVVTLAGVTDRLERPTTSACAVLLDAGGPALPSKERAQCRVHAAASEACRWKGLHDSAVAASAADAPKTSAPPGDQNLKPAGRQVLYKGRGMKVARLLVRWVTSRNTQCNTASPAGSPAGIHALSALRPCIPTG